MEIVITVAFGWVEARQLGATASYMRPVAIMAETYFPWRLTYAARRIHPLIEEAPTMNAPTSSHRLMPQLALREAPQALIDALQAHFGTRCSTGQAVREQHGRDESPLNAPPPAAVVFAESTADVAAAVALAAQYRVPVIPFGVGSSLEGHLLAVQGGISIDLARMNQVVAIHPEDLTLAPMLRWAA
jgi:hypothetical protein